MDNSFLQNFSEYEPEYIKHINNIKSNNIDITEYFLALGFESIILVDFNELTKGFIKLIDTSRLKIYVVFEDNPTVSENYPLDEVVFTNDMFEVFKMSRVDLILDSDMKKYTLRKINYDSYNCESCPIEIFLENLIYDEKFILYSQNVGYNKEITDDFFNMVKFRYKNFAVYGKGPLVDKFIERIEAITNNEVARLEKIDVKIQNGGRKIQILSYGLQNIHEFFYFGINKEVEFYKGNLKTMVVNIVDILKEIKMNYDLCYNLFPELQDKGVKSFCFLYPDFYRLNTMLKEASFPYFKKKPLLQNLIKDKRFEQDLKDFFCEYYSMDYIQGILKRPNVISVNGIKKYENFNTPFYNIINGNRLTTDAVEEPKATIHIFGKCVAMGRFVEDKNTIASFLQRKINEVTSNYKVINYGMEADVEINRKIRNLHLKKGDIIIILYRYHAVYDKSRVPFFDLSQLIMDISIGNREYFLDTPEHFNHRVNESIATIMFKQISQEHDLNKESSISDEYFSICHQSETCNNDSDDILNNPEFNSLISELKTLGNENSVYKKIGAIVMNCNPFTYGHKHLISHASKECELVYVLVVQEDKSYFSFEDRFNLVKAGCSEFENVCVIPSGKFVISTITFPEYFTKDAPDSIEVDPSNDVEIFAKYIAPALNVSVRFAGEEPLDIVTKRYNDTMKRILPAYGIDFEIIERKLFDNQVISASRVRSLLKEKQFEQIKDIVPNSTYNYLLDRFS